MAERSEVLRRVSCTHTTHVQVGGPLVGAPTAFGTMFLPLHPNETPTLDLHKWPSRLPESKPFSPHLQHQWYYELSIMELQQGAEIGRWGTWNMALLWLLSVKSVQ